MSSLFIDIITALSKDVAGALGVDPFLADVSLAEKDESVGITAGKTFGVTAR